jgi:hypothetical protein
MSNQANEPIFGSTRMTRLFAQYKDISPIMVISRDPGRWSELMNRASRAETPDELSESDRLLLLQAIKNSKLKD